MFTEILIPFFMIKRSFHLIVISIYKKKRCWYITLDPERIRHKTN
jgi:hypothetical protein